VPRLDGAAGSLERAGSGQASAGGSGAKKAQGGISFSIAANSKVGGPKVAEVGWVVPGIAISYRKR
jgi:hypothetical protein